MKISVCIGGSCHKKGSRLVVERLHQLIQQNHQEDKIALDTAFCIGKCRKGVSVAVDDTVYSVTPETVDVFYANNIQYCI